MPDGGAPSERWHITAELDHFVVVTYRVDLAELRDVLPNNVEPEVFPFDDGSDGGLVSAVCFVARGFHFSRVPAVRTGGTQVDYRAYVRVGDDQGVWFFGTSFDGLLAPFPRLVWGMPYHADRVRIRATGVFPASRLQLTAVGRWGTACCDLVDDGEAAPDLDGFDDTDTAIRTLTHPTIGWYRGRRDRALRYSVAHPELSTRLLTVRHARFDVFERLGLVDADTAPHSALACGHVPLDVHLPPTVVDLRSVSVTL